MSNKIKYEYDSKCEVLIKRSVPLKIIRRNNLVWKHLGPEEEQYARAIYLGQGCWERLDTISQEEAYNILKHWGYIVESE